MNNSTSDTKSSALAAVFQGAGVPLVLQSLQVPEPGANEAIVRIDCCTICGSDLHTITGARKEPTPSVLGHEILGTVTEVGSPPLRDIDGIALQPGDRVTWGVATSCFDCDRCRDGLPQKCRSLAKYGHAVAEGRYALSGGLAEQIVLRPGTTVVKINRAIPDEVICPVNCATATVAAAFRNAERINGQRVLIFGAGLLGLTATAFANTEGASEITVCDVNPARLEHAKEFGADVTVEWTSDRAELRKRLAAYDVVIELSGSPDAVEAACDFCDVGGRVILVGTVMGSRPVSIDPEQIVRRCMSIRGVHNYIPEDLRTAVSFLTQFHHEFPFQQVVEKSFPLAEINAAVDYARQHRPVRIAIRP